MNTKIEYMYRSGGNYKWGGEVILPGLPKGGMAKFDSAMRGTCEVDDQFIAGQVGLPEKFPWVSGEYPYDPEEDHCFHEFCCATQTDEASTLDLSPEDLLGEFQEAHAEGWEVFDPGAPKVCLFS